MEDIVSHLFVKESLRSQKDGKQKKDLAKRELKKNTRLFLYFQEMLLQNSLGKSNYSFW